MTNLPEKKPNLPILDRKFMENGQDPGQGHVQSCQFQMNDISDISVGSYECENAVGDLCPQPQLQSQEGLQETVASKNVLLDGEISRCNS